MNDIDKMKATLEALGWKDGTPKETTATEGFVVKVALQMGRNRPPLDTYVSGMAFVVEMYRADVFATKEEAEVVRADTIARSSLSERAKPGTGFASALSISVVPFVPLLH
jgi:hypothetical protein